MRPRFTPYIVRPGRLIALLQAIAFCATMAAAPLLHRATCDGVCSSPKFEVLGEAGGGTEAGHSCCHPAGPARDDGSRGCGCLDDCCSLVAQFTSAPVVADLAPPAPIEFEEPAPRPDETPRAPGPRLLPFPTGPPSAA